MLLTRSAVGSSLSQKLHLLITSSFLNYLMKVHFNVILPTLYQRDILSVITMDLHILQLYGNGILKKILNLRAME
jgi:methyltransferase-like protein